MTGATGKHFRWLGLLLAVGLLGAVTADARAGSTRRSENSLDRLRAQHRELHSRLKSDLLRLAQVCAREGLVDAVVVVERSLKPFASPHLRSRKLPTKIQSEIRTDLSTTERGWRIKLRDLHREYAKDLYILSRRVLHAGHPSHAYDLIREVAHYDPDNKSARKLLGFVRQGDEWMTPYAARMLRERRVWHRDFGWLPKSHVERYEKGERLFRGRWISAAKESELRRKFENGWEIRTEHYLIKTNHSLERGVRLAEALEDYHRFFFQTFASFFNTRQQMQKLFAGSNPLRRNAAIPKPYKIHYYRTREEYRRALIRELPQLGASQISITNGLYHTASRTAYFFNDPKGDNEATLFHEATHQLFYESQQRDRPIAEQSDFWIVEGIACYMESFRRENGNFSAGDPRFIRFDAARYRRLVDDYYVPLEKLTRMSMHAFQHDPNISRNYSQASGLAHFLMHYEDGRYRDAMIRHLSQIYNANLRQISVQSLEQLTEVSFADLDRQYLHYLKGIQADLDRRSDDATVQGTR